MELIFHLNNGNEYCTMKYTLWGNSLKVKINADLETANRCQDTVIDKLKRIERNRDKISSIVFKEWAKYIAKETPEDFAKSLHLVHVLVDVYRDDSVCVSFTVRSARNYTPPVDRSFELLADNSIE